MNDKDKIIEVVAAVIRRGDRVLLASRPADKPPTGWEFPGGKIEVGETPAAALIREIDEELGVRVTPGPELETLQNGRIKLHFIAAGMPDDGRLYFRGESGGRNAIVWRAEIRIPQTETSPDLLDVGVSCKAGGVEMLDGTFRLCGASAEIRNGEGRLSRKALVESLAKGGVSFTPSGKREIPGSPVFGDFI